MEMHPRVLKKYVTDDGACPYDKWFSGIKDICGPRRLSPPALTD